MKIAILFIILVNLGLLLLIRKSVVAQNRSHKNQVLDIECKIKNQMERKEYLSNPNLLFPYKMIFQQLNIIKKQIALLEEISKI